MLAIPTEVNATQDNWRFCDFCFVLYWNGKDVQSKSGQGACPGRPLGGDGNAQPHQGPSWDFYLFADTHRPGHPVPVPDPVKAIQPDWRFCDNCFSLYWSGDQHGSKGVCNAGDRQFDGQGHVTQAQPHEGPSWDFFLLADPAAGI
jgi:hypothetical protein